MTRTLLVLSLLGFAAPLHAQIPPAGAPGRDSTELVDRVLAVVGDSVILLSEVQRELQVYRAQNQPITEEELLENLINLQAVLQDAVKDSTLIPSAEELDERTAAQLATQRANFPDEATFQRALAQEGLTMQAYRDRLREQIRVQTLRTLYMQRRMQAAAPVVVSEAEMRAFFEEHKAELQQRPEILTVQQVLLRSGASDEAWARALQIADSLRAVIVAGGDFEALARQHSADSASAVAGGELGWVKLGTTVAEFQQAAFALMNDAVSNSVRTEFGYHVIRAERTRPGEKFLRHILITPEVVPADLERTRTLGNEVARRIRAGEDVLALARTYGDPEIPSELEVVRGQEAEQLPPEFVTALQGVRQGDVIGPIEARAGQRTYIGIQKVVEVRAAGEFTFEDVRDQIESILTQQKRTDRLYRDLRGRTYVEIRR
jgi:peptidyl-prolyl cis-trans isomerase SurA